MKISKIDKKLVKRCCKEVEGALEKYRIYRLTIPEECLPKITASYSLIPPDKGSTNQFYSSTENTAIERIEIEKERREYLALIEGAVNRCPKRLRELLIKRYMMDHEEYDYIVYNDLGLGETTYYRMKKEALFNLGIVLRIVDLNDIA